ncbi:MAG: hypothetical protein ACI837_003303 [Crocinitomicaceae bacterium]|jgi:hypothetical protein
MYSMKLLTGLFSILFLSSLGISQEEYMAQKEDELVILLDELRDSDNDADKATLNEAFKKKMGDVLLDKLALTYPFSKLTTVGFIDSPDELVRIVNWNVEQADKSQRYFGFVLHVDKRKKKYYVTELKEDLFGVRQPEEVVTSDLWYGALYYKIIPVKKGSKMIYTVLGWDGNTTMSNIKLIDAMYMTGSTVKFGNPIFKVGKEIKRRVFYEHSEKITMLLRYEENRGRIMMDHLSPEAPTMKGYYSFYVPDLSYDAFKFIGNKWVLHEDVIGVNKSHGDKQIVYVEDPRTGKLKKQVIDNKWENPEDMNAPAGGIEHVAVTPESDEKDSKKDSRKNPEATDPKAPKIDKKDKRDPTNLSIYDDVRKNKRRNRRLKRKRNKMSH